MAREGRKEGQTDIEMGIKKRLPNCPEDGVKNARL